MVTVTVEKTKQHMEASSTRFQCKPNCLFQLSRRRREEDFEHSHPGS